MGRTVVVWLIQTRQHEHGHIAFQFSSSQASLSTLYGQGGQWGTVYHTQSRITGVWAGAAGACGLVSWDPVAQRQHCKPAAAERPAQQMDQQDGVVCYGVVWVGKTGLSKAHRNEPSLWASCPSSRSTSLVRSGLSMTNQKRPSMSSFVTGWFDRGIKRLLHINSLTCAL